MTLQIPPLWDHQKKDIEFMLEHEHVFNGSDPGTGKTRVCIEAVRKLGLPTLILCPKSIVGPVWRDEFARYAPEIDVALAYEQRKEQALKSDAQVVVMNHDAVKWMTDHPEYLKRFDDGLLIVDESTAYKNPAAQRTRAALIARSHFARAAVMSGTFIPNGILDAFTQIQLADRGKRLGTKYYAFRRTVCEEHVQRGGFSEWIPKPGMHEALVALIADMTIRHRRDDCMDLPPNNIVRREFDLTPALARNYKKLVKQRILEAEEGTVSAVNAAVLRTKLLQLSSGAAYGEGGETVSFSRERIDLVLDLVDERPHSVVVYNWKHQKEALLEAAAARKFPYAVIDGEASMAERQKAVDDFQSGALKFILIHPASAGHGLTLTRGVATIWVSPIDNAEHFLQTNARIHRGGQTQKTETILVTARNTIEPGVYTDLIDGKVFEINNVLGLMS